jgi:LAO/AO transport system kinase
MSAVFDRDIQREIRSGNRQILAKAITNLENSNSDIQIPKAKNPNQVLGITGAPGVGKSTTVDAIVKYLRKKDLSVAVLAVDPSSPISGGALLGDRIRLSDHFTDPKVFIRSIATRGHLGGLSANINQVLNLIQLAKFDFIIIETVGVGQSEVEIMRVADTVCVVLAPGMGDGIQAAKAGLLEIGDIYLVNKADRKGALETKQDIEKSIELSMLNTNRKVNWVRPVLLGEMQNGVGALELMVEVENHRKAQKVGK